MSRFQPTEQNVQTTSILFFESNTSFPIWSHWNQKPILPRKLTWNPKMEVWKMIFLFKQVIFRFHVSFRECNIFCSPFRTIDFFQTRRENMFENPAKILGLDFSIWRAKAKCANHPHAKRWGETYLAPKLLRWKFKHCMRFTIYSLLTKLYVS